MERMRRLRLEQKLILGTIIMAWIGSVVIGVIAFLGLDPSPVASPPVYRADVSRHWIGTCERMTATGDGITTIPEMIILRCEYIVSDDSGHTDYILSWSSPALYGYTEQRSSK